MMENLKENDERQVTGRVEKVPEFFNTPTVDDTENTGVSTTPPVEKVGDLFNEHEIFAMAPLGGAAASASHAPWEGLVESPLQRNVPAPAPLRSGRPTMLTPAVMDEICLLLSVGLSRRQAAAYLDIDHSTISHAAARDADFAHNLRRAEELCTVQAQMLILAQSRKNWRAAAWLIEQNRKFRPALTEDEKNERYAQKLADKRRQIELNNATKLFADEADDRFQQEMKERNLLREQRRNEERFGPPRRRKKPTTT